MGYDVSIELRDAIERQAYDAAAEELGIEHGIHTWGEGDPSDWQIRNLWDGGSVMRDLAEFLSASGTRIKDEQDGYCPVFSIAPDALIRLGDVASTLRKELPEETDMLLSIGLIDEEDAIDLWATLVRGVKERSTSYLSVPVVRDVSVPALSCTLTHDDPSAPIPPGNTEATQLRWKCIATEQQLRDAERNDGDNVAESPIEELRARLADLRRRYEDIRPAQDTVSVPAIRANVSTCEHSISVETEKCDPMAGFAFKHRVSKAINEVVRDGYDTYHLYEIIASSPGLMLSVFERLGEIGIAAHRAGIKELTLSPSW